MRALVTGLCLLLGSCSWGWLLPDPAPPPVDGPEVDLTVVAWNAAGGRASDRDKQVYDRVLRQAKALPRADVIGLSEVRVTWATRLARALGEHHGTSFLTEVSDQGGDMRQVVLLDTAAFVEVDRAHTAAGQAAANQIMRPRKPWDRVPFVVTARRRDGAVVQFVHVHLKPKADGAWLRDRGVQAVLAADDSSLPTLAFGDFNFGCTTRGDRATGCGAARDALVGGGFSWLVERPIDATWCGRDFPDSVLDFVFADEGWSGTTDVVDGAWCEAGGDHRPVAGLLRWVPLHARGSVPEL